MRRGPRISEGPANDVSIDYEADFDCPRGLPIATNLSKYLSSLNTHPISQIDFWGRNAVCPKSRIIGRPLRQTAFSVDWRGSERHYSLLITKAQYSADRAFALWWEDVTLDSLQVPAQVAVS